MSRREFRLNLLENFGCMGCSSSVCITTNSFSSGFQDHLGGAPQSPDGNHRFSAPWSSEEFGGRRRRSWNEILEAGNGQNWIRPDKGTNCINPDVQISDLQVGDACIMLHVQTCVHGHVTWLPRRYQRGIGCSELGHGLLMANAYRQSILSVTSTESYTLDIIREGFDKVACLILDW